MLRLRKLRLFCMSTLAHVAMPAESCRGVRTRSEFHRRFICETPLHIIQQDVMGRSDAYPQVPTSETGVLILECVFR